MRSQLKTRQLFCWSMATLMLTSTSTLAAPRVTRSAKSVQAAQSIQAGAIDRNDLAIICESLTGCTKDAFAIRSSCCHEASDSSQPKPIDRAFHAFIASRSGHRQVASQAVTRRLQVAQHCVPRPRFTPQPPSRSPLRSHFCAYRLRFWKPLCCTTAGDCV